MLRTEILTELHTVLNNASSGGLWTTATLMRYLADGQDQFCRKTGYFVDFVSFQIVTTIGSDSYTTDERIIEVLDLFESSTNTFLGHTNEGFRRPHGYDPRYPLNLGTDTADTLAWQVDRETNIVTLVPTPTTERTFTLRVWRRPLVALDHQTNGSYDTEPEIPSEFHLALVEWAAYKALSHHDAEAQDPVKAAEHLANFKDYVRDGKERFRRTHRLETTVGTNAAYVV